MNNIIFGNYSKLFLKTDINNYMLMRNGIILFLFQI